MLSLGPWSRNLASLGTIATCVHVRKVWSIAHAQSPPTAAFVGCQLVNVSVSELIVMRMRACGRLAIILTLDLDNFASTVSTQLTQGLSSLFFAEVEYTDAAIAFNSLDCENLTLNQQAVSRR